MNCHHFRARTTQERVLDGLLGKEPWPEVEIRSIPVKGRGVFLKSVVQKNPLPPGVRVQLLLP